MDIWLMIFVFLEGFHFTTAGLDCYICPNVQNVSDCHRTDFCPNSQYCFIRKSGDGHNQNYTLGCAENNICKRTTTTAATMTTTTRTTTTTTMATTTKLLVPTHSKSTAPSQGVNATSTLSLNTTGTTPVWHTTTQNNTQSLTATTESLISNMTVHGRNVTSNAPAPLIGRREMSYIEDEFNYDDPEGRTWCCSTDSCNKHVSDPEPTVKPVTPPNSTCQDKPDFHCEVVKQYIDICKDIEKAKVVCKKSCDLCQLIDGQWSEWGNWSSCDVTCGNGTRHRIRACDSPRPAGGGDNCTGSDMDTEMCTEPDCPLDGAWGNWASWSVCSVTCGIGLQNRVRNCSKPYPDADGLFCLGAARDDKICIKKHCDEDTWLEWSSWSKCSHSCGDGLKIRTRQCNGTTLFGHSCSGDGRETDLCKHMECSGKADVLVSEWLDWSSWSKCSSTCGPGIKARSRDCNGSASFCFGDVHESVLCVAENCEDPVSAFLVNGVAQMGPANGTIVFSHVITNVGGDYNASTGQFTCRIPGVYSFFISIEKQLEVNQAYCQLMKNNNTTIYVGSRSAFIHDNTYQQASNSAVLELDIDDVIYLGKCSAPETFTTKSTFSGTLLVAHYN